MNKKTLFFDLFYTLIKPQFSTHNEFDVLGLSKEKWNEIAEDEQLYYERAVGIEKNPLIIIEKILKKANLNYSDEDLIKILELREERFKRAVQNVESVVLKLLEELKKMGYRMVIISNADVINIQYFSSSPLIKFFDEVIFSCDVGCVKPESKIYSLGLETLELSPEEVIFIGDGGCNELEGAKKLGMTTIFFNYFAQLREDEALERRKFSDYSAQECEELLNILKMEKLVDKTI